MRDFVLAVLIKATLVLVATGALTLLWRNSAAARRHLVWALALGAVLALPLVQWLGPSWPVLPHVVRTPVELAAPTPTVTPVHPLAAPVDEIHSPARREARTPLRHAGCTAPGARIRSATGGVVPGAVARRRRPGARGLCGGPLAGRPAGRPVAGSHRDRLARLVRPAARRARRATTRAFALRLLARDADDLGRDAPGRAAAGRCRILAGATAPRCVTARAGARRAA